MPLLILILIAVVAGYFLARSRYSKPIDAAAERVTDVTRDAADRVETGVRGVFRRKPKADASVIEGTAVNAPSAEKQPSRRVSETDTGTKTE